jgi:hypothetical protein
MELQQVITNLKLGHVVHMEPFQFGLFLQSLGKDEFRFNIVMYDQKVAFQLLENGDNSLTINPEMN